MSLTEWLSVADKQFYFQGKIFNFEVGSKKVNTSFKKNEEEEHVNETESEIEVKSDSTNCDNLK